jgi:hypothetical protein
VEVGTAVVEPCGIVSAEVGSVCCCTVVVERGGIASVEVGSRLLLSVVIVSVVVCAMK